MAKAVIDAARWTEDRDGLWLCLKTNLARRICEGMEQSKTYDVEIRRHREKRSLDANSYAWVLLDKLAEATGIPKEEIYREAIRGIGGNTETVCVMKEAAEKLREAWKHNGIGWMTDVLPSKLPGCVNVILYYGSSTFDTKQMSRLIDGLVQDCKAIGIETMPPDRLSALLEGWE